MEKFETGEKAVSNLEILSGKMLREILKYFYNAKLKGVATMKKADMVTEVTKRLVLCEHALPSGDGSGVVGAGAGDDDGH
jgi:hypothetical protein